MKDNAMQQFCQGIGWEPVSDRPTKQLTLRSKEVDVTTAMIRHFQTHLPVGYDLIGPEEVTDVMNAYGVVTMHRESKKKKWFCLATKSCRAFSAMGHKGKSPVYHRHLRDVHDVYTKASLRRRITSKTVSACTLYHCDRGSGVLLKEGGRPFLRRELGASEK